ncbi:dual OB domain-containing protein [Enterobacter ludwigii]|uniref:dual OB domain-containing protein n=1 Tax=Enterobacter ludwigii TaxID=299767 RepID=UPI00288A0C1C|nr:hypothetical protein [Enterobacter ludwigii]HDR2757016.1 hypothetical protein [Enterobacter mori]WNI44031.1 hypothetical protein RIK66_16800 [Enterobacter ludwigii]WNI55267.1 hypothetical protein RIL74_05740 [Enterobacter ludwigii]WNI80826.1 hypothetical protein RIK68_20960 [Enterobacter ludwigii]HDR2778524.1 hypothetical protein [Enterobacter mori]
MGKKAFVCLSKSKKPGGYCIAGKLYSSSDGAIGEWVRPLNKSGSICDQDCVYEDHTYAKTIDIIEAEFLKHTPQNFQTENHLIDSTKYWKKIGEYPFNYKDVLKLCDHPTTLWSNNHHSKGGKLDQVTSKEAANYKESLYFIYVDKVIFYTSRWQAEPIKVRGEFTYNNATYNLRVTDIAWINYFEKQAPGVYHENGRFVTVSLALDLHTSDTGTYHYKILAEVM